MTVNTVKLAPQRGLAAATQTHCMRANAATYSKCSVPYLSDKASQFLLFKFLAKILNELFAYLNRISMLALSRLSFQHVMSAKNSLHNLFITFNMGKKS